MELVVLPLAVLGAVPGGAFVPVIALAWWIRRRWSCAGGVRRLAMASALGAWVTYATFETYMYFWMQTVIAPIRIDLLLIAPVLLMATLLAVAAGWRPRRPPRDR